jgi:long-chain acyl-CoA synthetase
VAPGEAGEMLIAGPQLMSGYLGMPQQTHAALQRDAQGVLWLHTGDIVRYDEQGYFQVVDRKKDMINHSGLKVFPTRVERVLQSHPRVKEAAVVGRPDARHTEMVVAVVVPASDPEDPAKLEQELRTLCREHLSPYEVPAKVEFVQSLPRTALGKLMRKELKGGSAGSQLPVADCRNSEMRTSTAGPADPLERRNAAALPPIGNRPAAIAASPADPRKETQL